MTNIEWTDETWNPVRGCSRVSAGCENCYAERTAIRMAGPGGHYEGLARKVNGHPVWTGEVRCLPELLDRPLRWRKPRRVFVNSMSDLFHEKVPDEFIDRVFDVMERCPQHIFQVLTKRPVRMWKYLSEAVPVRPEAWPLPNVWLGVSVEDQATADERIPVLLDTPAAVRWVSAEPLLVPVDMARWLRHGAPVYPSKHAYRRRERLDWVVTGGESGPGARPCDVAWIRSIVEQCRAAAIPVFVKQLGARVSGRVNHPDNEGYGVHDVRLDDRKGGDPAEWPEDLRVREWPDTQPATARAGEE